MIAFLGGVVGSMIVALYMPIFKVFDMIGSSLPPWPLGTAPRAPAW